MLIYVIVTDKCKIVIHQVNTVRVRCYDVSAPFIGIVNRFRCVYHSATYRATNEMLWDQLPILPSSIALYLFPRTMMTPAFIEYVSNYDFLLAVVFTYY